MDFTFPIPVTELAKEYDLQVVGDTTQMIMGINEIHKVRKGDITFVDVEKYYDKAINSEATIIIINKQIECPQGKTLLISDNPFDVYNRIVWKHRPMNYISKSIGESTSIGLNTIVEHGAIIGNNVVIGDNCYIQAGVYIGDFTVIEDNVNIQAGALIGTDAFYFKKIEGKYHKWRSCGRVVICKGAEIGAGSTINRGVSGETVIGEGTKLDSQVHIAHGVVIGKHCLLAAQCGIAGKTVIGDNCILYGQVGVAQNLTIGDNTIIYAQSGVSKSLEGGKTYFGSPAVEAKEKFKELATLRHLTKNN